MAPPKTIGMTFSSPVMTIKPQIRALRLKIYDYRKSSIKPPSQISPSPLFRGRKLLSLPLSFNPPPPPGPSLILHNKITKIWSDPVLLTHMLEVQTCFDLWLQDLLNRGFTVFSKIGSRGEFFLQVLTCRKLDYQPVFGK